MCGDNSKLTSGDQISFEQEETAIKTSQNEKATFENYAKNELPKSSPIEIPNNAEFKVQIKDEYTQVKYDWKKEEYKYQARWHTKTPNSPGYESESWVVERKIPGIGSGLNARHSTNEVLVGTKWISKKIWQEAIYAKKNGTATVQQKEVLKNGHHKTKK